MTYPQTIEYLYSALPLFSRSGAAAYKKDLHNIVALCAALGEPQEGFPSIHVGGTNGKGSVSHMLAAVLQAAGYRTGLYTSPHLFDFRERIRTNGQFIPEAFVVRFVSEVRPLIDALQPSFFEITVAMAFQYFREAKVDIAVVEVGLGGRLDSTNIIQPILSIITNIGMDHADLLGATLPAIAGEKAGIIKRGVPALIGERQAVTDDVFVREATAKGASLQFVPDRYRLRVVQQTPERLVVQAPGGEGQYALGLAGGYQAANAATVLAAVAQLNREGFPISEEALTQGLSRVRELTGFWGRWEVLKRAPYLIADVAHNEPGLAALWAQVTRLKEGGHFKGQTHVVTGMVRDKDRSRMLPLFPREASYYFTQANSPRALPGAELKEEAAQYGLAGNTYTNVNEAVRAALLRSQPDDLILVCGSIFLVAELDSNAF